MSEIECLPSCFDLDNIVPLARCVTNSDILGIIKPAAFTSNVKGDLSWWSCKVRGPVTDMRHRCGLCVERKGGLIEGVIIQN